MHRTHTLLSLAIALNIGVAAAHARPTDAPGTQPIAIGRTADDVFADLKTATIPAFDKSHGDDKAYAAEFQKQFNQTLARRAELIGELETLAPDRAETRALIVERWRALGQLGRGKEVAGEIDPFFTHAADDATEGGAYFAAILEIEQLAKTDADKIAAIDRYEQRSPTDKGLLQLLSFADRSVTEKASHATIAQRIIKAAPDSKQAEIARSRLDRVEQIGKPFALDFNDAITGEHIAIDGALKGKVVVIDFWATWCAPCKAYVPRLKAIYDAEHANGLEIVSISLDDAGDSTLELLKKTAAKEGMAWRHDFAGNGFDSEIAKHWGINSIPQIFVIDRAGNLVSVDARAHLEDVVKPLLAP